MTTIERVKTAFRKLKAHVYFDKTALPLRDKVVEFESQTNFAYELNNIAEAYDKIQLGKNSPLMVEILASINVLPFPKKMLSAKNNDDMVISVGNPEEKPIVENLQYFIDMDVRGHILGILWIMAFGKRLDEFCFKNARGNRLRNMLIWDDNDEALDSPALFEPYFAQYSLWRDKGLLCAEDILDKKHDALIVTLDLKKFYYRTGINESVFNEILENEDSDNEKAVHAAIFLILRCYTEILHKNSIDHNGIALPIGFLPSAVLSNWCLSKFDKGILDFWNPAYYGRYVDDIIIVEKIEKKSEIYKMARKNELTKSFVIDYYLGNGRRKNTLYFASKVNESVMELSLTGLTPTDENDAEDLYRVNTAFCLSEESLYEFQSSKTRIIALFTDNNSTALINKFKQEIYENVSEFRLMPKIGESFLQDDFSEFYQLENDATINKLRGVREIQMDKFELSKFLGRYRIVSSLVDGGSKKKFTRVIDKVFNDRELIENYILWERVFEIFITDKDYSGFSKFAERVKKVINALTSKDDSTDIEPVKSSLRSHLTASFNRVLSLVWGEKAKEIVEAICDNEISILLRCAYLSTRMSNKYVIAIPVEILSCPTDANNTNFTSFTDGFEYICNNMAINSNYAFLPYFRQAQDIAFAMFLTSICGNNGDNKQKLHTEYLNEVANELPGALVKSKTLSDLVPDSKARDCVLINIGEQKVRKLKIAVANVSVSEVWNLENALKGKKPNRKNNRYLALTELMNIAIKNKVDMLVLPENYVPIEWLRAMATKAAREDLAIVTGVEHIIVGKNVYNYTAVILPFKYYKTIPTSAVFFQLKKHYSPEENRLIEGYNFKSVTETEKRPIYRWKDCYFPVYCCFELAAIHDRAEFMSWADMVVAVEFNKDTNYFGNIVESLTRDLHCYCVQVNTSEYGDSRITQPTKREKQNILTVKGGSNPTLLVGEIDIQYLREFQIKKYELQKNGYFKPTPPGIDINIVRRKMENKFD